MLTCAECSEVSVAKKAANLDLRQQQAHDLRQGCLGQGGDFGVGAVLDWVGDEDGGGIVAECASLGGSGGDKLRRSHEDTRDGAPFHIHDVVHTARRARASISQRFDKRINLRGDLLLQGDWRGASVGWLAVPFHFVAFGR